MAQCGAAVCGFDCDREAFLGPYGGFHAPAAVVRGACSGSEGFSDNTCGALSSDFELAPGESVDVLILLGIGEAAVVGQQTVEAFGNVEACERALEDLRRHWHKLLDSCQVETPDSAFDAMVNT